jgi:hypothetical protein
MKILRRSGWTFDTSAGGGIGYGSFTVEGGIFALRDLEGVSHQYSFSAFGTSISRSLTGFFHIPKFALPKFIIKRKELGGSGSTADFNSYGKLFLTESFKGADLTKPQSLEGGVVYFEGAAGYLVGGSASLMILGISRELILLGIGKPDLIGTAIRSAPAVLTMTGVNEGLQNSLGGAFMLGQITYKGLYADVGE